MSHDRETRRTVTVLVCVAIMTVSSGCRRSPFQRLEDGSAGAPGSASTTGAVPPELPALMAVPESGPGSGGVVGPGAVRASSRSLRTDPGLEHASGPPVPAPPAPAPTPLLDAALKRAEAEERLQREAIRAQQSAPDPSPASGPKVQTASMVTRPRGRDPETASPGPVQPRQASFIGSKPQARPASLKEQPQPKIPPALDGESDLVAAPLVPEPASAKPADSAAVWAESLDRLKTIARESARQPGAGEGAALWLLRSQVVEWLASETLRPASQALLRRAVASMADATTTPAVDATTRSAEIRSAVLALEDRVPLGITELRLCRKVLGFGAFELLDGPAIKAGQPVIIYCELSGLRYQTVDQSFVSRLSSRVELVTARDGVKVWDQSLGEAEDRCRSRRRDYYVNYRITIPTTVAPGDYRIRLTQTDLVAGQTASAELPVTIPR